MEMKKKNQIFFIKFLFFIMDNSLNSIVDKIPLLNINAGPRYVFRFILKVLSEMPNGLIGSRRNTWPLLNISKPIKLKITTGLRLKQLIKNKLSIIYNGY